MWTLVLLWLALQLFDYTVGWPWLAPRIVGLRMSPDRLLFVALFALLVVGSLSRSTNGRRVRNPGEMMVGFAALCLLSWYFCGADTVQNRWLTTIFHVSGFPFCAYLLTRRLLLNSKEAGQLLALFLAMAFYFAITGIAEHFDIAWLVWPSYIRDPGIGLTFDRARGPLLGTADQGWVLVGGAAIACMRFPRSERPAKLFLVLLSILCLAAAYFTYKRSVWLVFVAAVGTATWLRRRAVGMRVVFALGALLLLVAVTGVASKLSWYGPTLFSDRSETVEYRKDNLVLAWDTFKTHPLMGVGYGVFCEMVDPPRDTLVDRPRLGEGNDGNHNFVLGLAAELGIAGLSLYLGIFAVILTQLWSFRRRLSDDEAVLQELLALAVAMTVAFFLQGLLGDNRFQVLPHNYLFVMFGVAAAAGRCHEGADDASSRGTKRGAARCLSRSRKSWLVQLEGGRRGHMWPGARRTGKSRQSDF